MATLSELIAQRAELDNQIEELKPMTGKRWRGDVGETYYVIDVSGEVAWCNNEQDIFDTCMCSLGNYYQTEAQAIAHRERLIATQQIIDRIAELNAEQGWVADWEDEEQPKFNIYYRHAGKRFVLDEWWYIQYSPSEFYGSEKTIKTLIEEMQPQLKLWLGVEQ